MKKDKVHELLEQKFKALICEMIFSQSHNSNKIHLN
jgi:hypothetical protein